MSRYILSLCVALVSLSVTGSAAAFCGFYVAKADTKLFNKASQVALVRHDNKTVMTMANDYQGDPKEFAVVIPVPTFIEREQINVGDKKVLDHLDAYSAPRLVEYFDRNPCERLMYKMDRAMEAAQRPAPTAMGSAARAKTLGVKIEAKYSVGEYDILILSAKQSGGLETWLKESGYRIPAGASKVLGSYIKQNMKFFVAKVNLKKQSKLGFSYLRPLQVAYESPKFMLPIRLGTVNADGPQELFIYTLTKKGRVETTNYRTVKLPTGMDIPVHIKKDFGDFYKDMFSEQVKKENMKTVFLEYAWDMNWCDPCAADPLSDKELRQLGVFWLQNRPQPRQMSTGVPRRIIPPQAKQVYITRMHVRYDAKTFPEDLHFQETSDRKNFQGRYVLRHAWDGSDQCEEAESYRRRLKDRHEKEAQTLAALTGWDVNEIRKKMEISKPIPGKKKKWYQDLWPQEGKGGS